MCERAFIGDPGVSEAVYRLLKAAREGRREWLDGDYAAMNFRPAADTARPGDGPPHIRLDRAAEFLIGDRL